MGVSTFTMSKSAEIGPVTGDFSVALLAHGTTREYSTYIPTATASKSHNVHSCIQSLATILSHMEDSSGMCY